MARILVVRREGYVETADAWAQVLRDEGHEVVLTGPDAEPDVESGIALVHAAATQEDVSIVLTPGADKQWAHELKHALKEDDIALAPPKCDLGDLLTWVARREDR